MPQLDLTPDHQADADRLCEHLTSALGRVDKNFGELVRWNRCSYFGGDVCACPPCGYG